MNFSNSDPKRRALLNLLLREEGLERVSSLEKGRRKDTNSVPLSFTQQQMWYLDQLEPGNPSYNIPIVARLNGPLNVMALEKSFNEIVRRHESLRTTFAAVEGVPVQRIASALTVTLPVVDLVTIPESEREARVVDLVTDELRRSFDLTRDPLLRLRLLKVDLEEYVLVIASHHIAMDGLSMEVLFREISALYEAFSMGRPSPLPELPLQYADFVHWQNERLQGEVLEQNLSYWKKQLERAPAMLELPTDHSRPTLQTFRGASQSITLSKSLTEQIKGLSRREGVTVFMTMLAALQAFLSRITGQEDIVVGSPIAGRNRVEVEGLIGLFINTLVLRTNLSGDPSFRELLQRVRDVVLGAFAHQEVPFEKLMGELHVKRDLSRNTLFQVLLNFRQQKAQENFTLSGLTVEEFPFRKGLAKFDLTLAVVERPETLHCSVKYNTDLFEATTILRLLGNFEVLLEGIIADPDQRLSGLSLLTSAERRQLMLDWNNTKKDYLLDECIAELFEKQTERTPNYIAVVFEESQLTYRELNNAANRLAAVLSQKGIGRGCYVPILMERSIEVPLAMLAIMKVGAAFVPLDIHWPIGRLKQALEELDSQVILANNTASFLEEELGRCFVIVSGSQNNAPATNPQIPTDPRQPIYAIYTSGSTGVPKAVVVPHRGITNRFLWMNEFFGCEAASSVLQTTPHLYDSAVWQFFWPLINGGTTIIPSPGLELDADYLSNLIHRHSITMTDFVPSVFNTIVPQLTDDTMHQRLASLRCVIVGGEEITPRTTYTFLEHYTKIRVVNLYGPTEASIGCICYEVTGKDGGKIPIGKPISNVYVLILDGNMKPVPIGVPGELYLSGICLGVGYLHDEEKTNAAFLDNPFSEIDHTTIYRTGDRARYLPDGNIEFLGRMDNQVKVRGFRIELREIEAVLSQHPGVQQAAVVVREDSPGDKHLVAYIVVKQGSACTATEIRSFLKTKLPNYMVPSAILFLDLLPLTANGKLDRRALPPPDPNRPELECSYVPPRTALEKSVAKIWAEILNVDKVGIHDNFFALGGHSLKATQVVARLSAVLQLELPLRNLFEAPSVAELADLIVGSRRGAKSPEYADNNPGDDYEEGEL